MFQKTVLLDSLDDRFKRIHWNNIAPTEPLAKRKFRKAVRQRCLIAHSHEVMCRQPSLADGCSEKLCS